MKLLLPLGLLGLLGIIALIIIYIIRPNYQQKLISSTFIWRLSLKYRKKRIPISRLRNIILVICQVLIITIAALILAKPAKVLREKVEEPEVVLIIDSSASMRTGDENTRFERAVNKATEQANQIFDKSGIVSVILAGNESKYLIERAGASDRIDVIEEIDALLDEEMACSYGSSDLESAITKAEEVLQINPSAKVYLYTDVTYSYVPDTISYINVRDPNEWNAAILDATAKFEDNYYTFYVDVASYGQDIEMDVKLEIYGANAMDSQDQGSIVTLNAIASCANDETTTLIFKYLPDEEIPDYEFSLPEGTYLCSLDEMTRVYSYQNIHISIDEEDSLILDNSFDIFGGLKQILKIQYYSIGNDPVSGNPLGPNIFVQEALAALKKNYEDRWDIQITEVKKGSEYEAEGYDFYIFEHEMPEKLPSDGATLLIDPIEASTSFGLQYVGIVDLGRRSVYLAEEESHPILQNITAPNISVSRYVRFSSFDPDFSMLLSYAGDPMLLVKNTGADRIAVLCFSLHYSNLPMLVDFPLLFDHIFTDFLPATVVGNAFETYEPITLHCQGDSLSVKGNETDLLLTEFPTQISLSVPGSYKLSQTTYVGKTLDETIFVKMPRAESNVYPQADSISSPYFEVDESDFYEDLLMYLAIALVALLTLEWYLQHKESKI